MRLFKYFSALEYAQSFMNGEIYHQTLGYYRDYEDATAKRVIGDEFESTRIFRPKWGVVLNNKMTGRPHLVDGGFESSIRAGEIFVFCFSLDFTEELKQKFKAVTCIEVLKPQEFIQRWREALPNNSVSFDRRVDYYEKEEPPGNIWPQPELIATTKLKQFSYQKEYRLGFSTTDALNFGQSKQVLVERKIRPKPSKEEHRSKSIAIGNISDVCKQHEF
jgi:hypothetical protein